MYLPPLGKELDEETIKAAFEIMNTYNENKDVSRIENIEQEDIGFYKDLGYQAYLKSKDYLYKTQDLIGLRGNRFKSKRALCNYFKKNYKYRFVKYQEQSYNDCQKLVKSWRGSRLKKYNDDIYTAMLEQSGSAFKHLLENFKFLGAVGFLVQAQGEVKACSFGYKLNNETFCIIFEIADLNIKGISQFIFREFCRKNDNFKFINAMDDSGLENLRKVKLSYHPCKLEESFCVKCIER